MKGKKATAGERLLMQVAGYSLDEVRLYQAVTSQAIDRLIARERRKERNDCYLLVCGMLNKFRNEALRGQHKRDVAFVCDDMIEAAWKALYPECIKSAKKGAQR